MWTCPTCGRKFKHANQDHSCAVSTLETHLEGKPDSLIQLFRKIHEFAVSLAPTVRVSPVKNAILYADISNFLAVKLRRDHLIIEFSLLRGDDVFPVFKTIRVTKYKICHFVAMGEPAEFTKQIQDWIKEAYHVSIDT